MAEAPPKRRWTRHEEATYLRAKRPWLAFFDPATRKVPVPHKRGEAARVGLDGAPLPPPPLAPIQLVLGDNELLEVFLRLPPRDAARCAAVCRQWRVVSEAQPLWRAACLAVPQWRRAESEEGGEQRRGRRGAAEARVERYCERYFDSDWRSMYRLRPRLRTDGIYISRNQYLRRGQVELRTRVAVHIVRWFRYLVFLPDGSFLYRTTPSPPSAQWCMARARTALRTPGVLSGELSTTAAGGVHTAITTASGQLSVLHTWLRLRSTCPGAHNRLDIRSMVSVDDGATEPPEPDADFDAYTDGDGAAGWHAAAGVVGAWEEEGAVRAHSRGLTPYVFVPWEDLDTTDLNLDTDQMDYYVPG